MNGNKEKVYIMTFTKTTFNGDLLVLGSRWSGSWRRLVSTVNQFLFGSLQFPHVIRQLLSMQLLLLVLERSIRRHWRPGVGLLDAKGENPRRRRRGPGW